jgi:hypothetical protein
MNLRHAALVLLALPTGLMAADPAPKPEVEPPESGVAKSAPAKPQVVKHEQSWSGSAKDEAAAKTMPKVATDKAKLAEIWKACERTDAVPEIDFSKSVVVVSTSVGSRINVGGGRLKNGELTVLGMGTMDILPGFRYVIAVFPREGVKSVNGEKLPE